MCGWVFFFRSVMFFDQFRLFCFVLFRLDGSCSVCENVGGMVDIGGMFSSSSSSDQGIYDFD